MARRMECLSYDLVRELFNYCPETGILTWAVRPARRVHVGDIAGTLTVPGYWEVRIKNIPYRVHSVIWLWMTGTWPDDVIDHIDTDGANNRWLNLRPATHAENTANRRRNVNNSSGFKGVSWHAATGKWQAYIRVNYKRIHLGIFDTPETAHDAYRAAATKYFGAYARAE